MVEHTKDQFFQKWWFWTIIGILAVVIIGNLINNSSKESDDAILALQEKGYSTCILSNARVNLLNLYHAYVFPEEANDASKNLTRVNCETEWYVENDSDLKERYNSEGKLSP